MAALRLYPSYLPEHLSRHLEIRKFLKEISALINVSTLRFVESHPLFTRIDDKMHIFLKRCFYDENVIDIIWLHVKGNIFYRIVI